MERLQFDSNSRVIVMTGAGASAESGVPTFRDANGLWEGNKVEDVASPYGFMEDPQKVWNFYSQRRANVMMCDPNTGHLALAELERQLGDRFLLVTQNVDDLHERAGSKRVAKVHGNLFRNKCSQHTTCPYVADDHGLYFDTVPKCPVCGADARPEIVWFGERLQLSVTDMFYSFCARAQMDAQKLYYVAVGTSGAVYPVASFVYHANTMGAESHLVNLEQGEHANDFHSFHKGKAGEILPRLFFGS